MNLLILTESGPGIGYGHLNRCLAFAEKWLETGQVVLIDRGQPGRMEMPSGLEVRHLDWINHFDAVRADYLKANRVLVDSYNWTDDLYQLWRPRGLEIVILDDGRAQVWTHGLIINGGIGAERSSYPTDTDTFKALTGVNWQPLRRVFWTVPE